MPRESGETAIPDFDDALSEQTAPAFHYVLGDLIAGKYRLTRSLGVGGMGQVWKAHNEVLDVDVAIKVLRRDVQETSAGDRLLREARAAARLGHPAIVRIFDFGTAEGGEPFIVMELLEGEDLATTLERHGRMSATRSVRTILPIAHALAAAHAKEIVHRDVKPENIFLARIEGDHLQPKIVDFGIAQVDRAKNLRLTQTGTVVGTPSYMSPEQARGEASDHRADIWSVSVVLYEMVTGRLPFDGKNANALLHAIITNEAPSITTFGVGDAELWSILARGLTKNADERYQSMEEFGVALATWLLSKDVAEDLTGASIRTTWFRGNRPPSSLPPPPEPVRESRVPVEADITTQVLEPRMTRRKIVALLVVGTFVVSAVIGLALRTPGTTAPAAGSASAAPVVPSVAEVFGAAPAPSASSAVPAPPASSSAVEPAAPTQKKSSSRRAARAPAPLPARKTRILKDPIY